MTTYLKYMVAPLLLGTSLIPSIASADPPRSDWYLDSAGDRQSFDPTHRRLNAPIGKPKVWRALVESALGLAIGTTWYFLDDETNRVDWDNPQFKERFSGEAWRLDNNSFGINFLAHPLNGAGFYVLARVNHLGPGWSALNSFGFSLLWELGIEFKEKVSINDQIVTPIAGVAVGEFAYRFGRYLNSVTRPNALQHGLRWVLALGESGHRAWDGIPPRAYGATDRFGYETAMWHRLELGYSVLAPVVPESLKAVHSYQFSGEFVALPGYHDIGHTSRWFYQLEFSKLEMAALVSSAGGGFGFDSEVLWAGHYYHDHEPGREKKLDGVSTVVGVNLTYGYHSSTARGFDERYSPMSFPGLAGKLWLAEGDLRFELSSRMNIDFSGISALSYSEWAENHPGVRGKTVLAKQGYFYGFGPSTATDLALSIRNLQLTASVRAALIDSSEGIDRSQELLEVDERARSTVTEWSVGARVVVPGTPLIGKLGYEQVRWYSWVDGFEARARAEQVEFGLSVTF